ncbi:MAG TPA: hypothetical protein VLT45_31585 [Kofleriaceae bacterium]|nr:hypothetical protein [Kofleriaceae bacterium]
MMAKAKTKKKPANKRISIAVAAGRYRYTTAGLYAAIKRGDLQAKRVDGRWTTTPADMKAFIKAMTPVPQPEVLTDEEFIRRMWENDPD